MNNLSFGTGVFYDDLEIAHVCPVFEDGNYQEIANYQPISVLPILSKVFESAIIINYKNVLRCTMS